MRSLHPVIIEAGLADQRELDALDAQVRAHLADPEVMMTPHLMVTAWGRKHKHEPGMAKSPTGDNGVWTLKRSN